jgi:hypothetical protein
MDDEPKEQDMFATDDDSAPERRPNLSDAAETYLQQVGGTVETLFYHALAVMHAPVYRTENAGALRQDWPRIPLPADGERLQASAGVGQTVAALLDVEREVDGVTTGTIRPELRDIAVLTVADNAAPDFHLTGWGYLSRGATMPKSGTLLQHDDGSYDVYLNDTTFWRNVPERVWEYTLGGYPVLKKWLSYRDADVLGRDLRRDEVRTFMHIARRIEAILMLEPQLNGNYQAVTDTTYS